MGFVVVVILLGLVALVGVGIAIFRSKAVGVSTTIGALILAGGVWLFGSLYTQDPGQAMVLKSFTGEVVGQNTVEGMHTKSPWVSVTEYDIRNQQVIFAHPTGSEGQGANGPQITVQDAEGVSANIDITVRYSIDPNAVTDIYKRYGSQQNFVNKFIENDIRAGVRLIPTQYTTLELLTTGRAEAEQGIRDYLEARWDKAGVLVETVSLQEIRYSDEVKARFDAAQSARIEVEKAQAELEAAEVSSKQKIVQAEAEAEANRILAQSLTDTVLKQRYLDTLKDLSAGGNTIVIPDGFNGLVNVN